MEIKADPLVLNKPFSPPGHVAFKIMVSGSRYWTDPEPVIKAFDATLKFFNIPKDCKMCSITVIHGDCKGLDRIAGAIAKSRGWYVEAKSADFSDGKKGGPIRNREMIATNPNIILMFNDDLANSRGTKDVYNLCTKGKIPYALFNSKSFL